MLKKVMFAVVATAFVAATAISFQVAPAAAAAETCKAAAKAKFPSDLKARHEFKKSRKGAAFGPFLMHCRHGAPPSQGQCPPSARHLTDQSDSKGVSSNGRAVEVRS
jgi:hypothetical protein